MILGLVDDVWWNLKIFKKKDFLEESNKNGRIDIISKIIHSVAKT